jgi:hypothetical protein
MLERVYNFGQANLGSFPRASAASNIINSIGSAVSKLKNHVSQQVSGAGAIQQSGISHQDARKALKSKLDSIFQTARVLNLGEFYLPRQRTDSAYIAAGQSFGDLARPHEEQLVNQGLPLNFIVALRDAVSDLQRAAQAKSSSKGAHSGSIAEFNNTLTRAMTDLKRFDALVKNTVGNDAGIMAAWKIARRVARTGSAAKAAAAGASAAAAATAGDSTV